MNPDGKILIVTTVANEKVGKEIAERLLADSHAACINILPNINSFYVWKGEIINDNEFMLFIKTREDHYVEVQNIITEISDYEVPEIIVIKLDGGYRPYLDWIDSCLHRSDK